MTIMENERKKREKNIIFHCLVGMKNERKKNRVDEVFHLKIMNSPFFFLPNWWKKEREDGIKKENIKLSTFFHHYTFNNKNILVLCFLSFHFSTIFTKQLTRMIKNINIL